MDISATANHNHLYKYMINLNQIDKDYTVRWQFELENTKERILPVYD